MKMPAMPSFEEHMSHVSMARSRQDYDEAMMLRYLHICKWNSYEKDRGDPWKSIGDKHDNYTDYIMHREDNGQVSGILRLIKPSEHGFFMEQYFNLSDYLPVNERTLELCELVTHEDYRLNAWIVGRILVRLGKYLIDNDISSAAAISIEPMHPIMQSLGFKKTDKVIMTGWNKNMTLFCSDNLDRVIENIIRISPASQRSSIAAYYGR